MNRRTWLKQIGGGLMALLPTWHPWAARGAVRPAKPWHAGLAEAIATSDFRKNVVVSYWKVICTSRTNEDFQLVYHSFIPIDIDSGFAKSIDVACELIGSTNDRSFCGVAPGRLLLESIGIKRTATDRQRACYCFHYIKYDKNSYDPIYPVNDFDRLP